MSLDATGTLAVDAAVTRRREGLLRDLVRDRAALLGAIFLALLVIVAVLAPLVAPHSPSTTDILSRVRPPAWEAGGSWSNPLGTDPLGRDVLSRLIYGARLSLVIAASVVLISCAVGTALGLIAGYKGGRIDNLIMRTADAQLAFPGLLLILLVLAAFGTSLALVVLVLACYGWMSFARLVRGMVLQLRGTPAIQSAEMAGCSTSRILRRHLLPNVYSALIAQSMLDLARIVLAEASLSYLGLGVQPPDASWGLMVAENQSQIQVAWWTVVFPGVALSLTVIAINLVANWLRVQTDPAQRQRRFAADMPPLPARADAGGTPPEPGEPALLAIDELRVRFHTQQGPVDAVRGVSFDVRPGETLGLVGESGSGKSTVALALIDLVPPPGRVEETRMRWEGRPIGQDALRRLRGAEITTIFQDPMTSLNPLVTVGRQIGEVLVKHKGMSRAAARIRALELLELVGVPSPEQRLDHYPHQLSGGLRQRVMIAIAIAPEPKLIIADEPTTALDTTIQAQILDLIAGLQRRLGIAMILITHDLGVVARVCDRVAVMYGGRVVEEGPAARLLTAPSHRYTEALLSAVPRMETRATRLTVIPGRPPAAFEPVEGCPFRPRCGHATAACADQPPLERAAPRRHYACWHPAPQPERAPA